MIDGQFTDLNAEVDVTHQRVYILPQEVIDLKEKKKTLFPYKSYWTVLMNA